MTDPRRPKREKFSPDQRSKKEKKSRPHQPQYLKKEKKEKRKKPPHSYHARTPATTARKKKKKQSAWSTSKKKREGHLSGIGFRGRREKGEKKNRINCSTSIVLRRGTRFCSDKKTVSTSNWAGRRERVDFAFALKGEEEGRRERSEQKV